MKFNSKVISPKKSNFRKVLGSAKGKLMIAFAFIFMSNYHLFAQATAQQANGAEGINQATQQITDLFGSVSSLMLAVAGVVGLVGAMRVYSAWQSGDQDINKKIMGWLGACIFIVVVGVILENMFMR